MMNDSLGITPVYNLDKNNDGAFGGNGAWIFFLFFLLAWGGNGLGGFGGNNGALGQINNDFLYTNLKGTLDNGFNQVANQGFSTQKAIDNGFAGVNYNLATQTCGIERAIDNCCCNTNRNIDSVRYDMSKGFCDVVTNANMNTRDIIANQTANTQRIIDTLTNDKIESLRTELQSAQLALANQSQTSSIVSQLRPCPIPAYTVPNPYCNCHGVNPSSTML